MHPIGDPRYFRAVDHHRRRCTAGHSDAEDRRFNDDVLDTGVAFLANVRTALPC